MDNSALLRFLNLELSELSTDEIVRVLESTIDEAGFDYYTLTRQPLLKNDPENLVLAGRWPEGWPEIYVKRKYAAIDPTIRYLGYCQRGFAWDEASDAFSEDSHASRIGRMLKQAKRFGLMGGYVFPVHGRRGLAGVLSVGGQKVKLSPVDIGLFETVARKAFWAMLAASEHSLSVIDPVDHGVSLTKREVETLNLLAEGFTSGEMGSTLGLSAHTVDWYMNGIQNKLDARNRHHAVAIAFRRGFIN